MVKEHEREKSARCELGSELILAYSGLFLECLPPVNSDITGYVLTHSGKLFYRKKKNQPWLQQTAPSAYLFRDCACQRIYEVNSCKCSIKATKFEGRVLDCSAHAIFEVNKCGEWTEVCDLDNPKSAAATQEIQVDCLETVALIDVLAGLKNVKYLPALSSADAFLDVSVDNVANQITATLLNAQTPPVDGPAVSLVYKGWLVSGLPANKWAKQNSCNQVTKKKVYVTVLIERVNEDRLAATGVLGAGTAVNPNQIPAAAVLSADEQLAVTATHISLAPNGFAPLPADAVQGVLINWTTASPRYESGIDLDTVTPPDTNTGVATIQCTGDYEVDLSLGYFAEAPLDSFTNQVSVPYFLLWRQSGAALSVIAAAPITSVYSGTVGTPHNLALSGQANLLSALTLLAGDLLYVTYYDANADPEGATYARSYNVNGITSQWHIEALGAPSN
jgi:hypothetical protein